jgi:uncharacterized protein (TIGR02246 family)
MKNLNIVYGLVIYVIAVGHAGADEPSKADQQAAEKEIRAAAASFAEAFKKRDAEAIAAYWTPDGVYVNEVGQKISGRKSIQSEYETLFKDCPAELEIRIETDSVRLVSADTAIEEGRAALTPQPSGAGRVMSGYHAVHVKQGGRWLIAELRDTRIDVPPHTGSLQDLDWLVGTWRASNDKTSVVVKCRWVENNRFLFRSNTVIESGKATADGFEVIGIHPSTQRITSWSFNADGSHSVGVWSPMDGGWAVDSVGVMEDGSPNTATNVLSRTDDDSLTWKSVERSVGEVLLPDMPEVTLKREP